MRILIFAISILILMSGIFSYLYFSPKENLIQKYGTRPTHPKFQRVVVTVDGCEGDLDKTINSVLSQDVRVSEIATDTKTCNISNMC